MSEGTILTERMSRGRMSWRQISVGYLAIGAFGALYAAFWGTVALNVVAWERDQL